MMKILVNRVERDAHAIRSFFVIDGVDCGYVLERVGHEIPKGVYRLELKPDGTSGFDKQARGPLLAGAGHLGMIRLCDVPGRTEILIHWGNFWSDSEGCLLVGLGKMKGPDGALAVSASQRAYANFYPRIAAAIVEVGAEIEILERGV
tara:strand:- start:558 stop:1001 length:444 start_codon:yes stop_codon:yes gene_type:complete